MKTFFELQSLWRFFENSLTVSEQAKTSNWQKNLLTFLSYVKIKYDFK